MTLLFRHAPPCLLAWLAVLVQNDFLSHSPMLLAQAKIHITQKEKKCLEDTVQFFQNNDGLIASRHNYATSMEMDMTSMKTMTAAYADDKLADYETLCESNGGIVHLIKIDFFDCTMQNMKREVELTLKGFMNCLASTEACDGFDQENLLEEAWEEMGLHCELEPKGDAGGSDDNPPSYSTDDDRKDMEDDDQFAVDDEVAKEEEKEAEEGAEEAETIAEYTPKDAKKKKGGSRFFRFLVFVSVVGGVGYFLQKDRHVRRFRGQLPWGGVTTSSYQSRGPGTVNPNMFQTSYNLVAGDEEINFGAGGDHELQLSTNLTS